MGIRWMLLCGAALAMTDFASPAISQSSAARAFHLRYAAEVTDLPATAHTVRIWMPYPTSDAWQTIRNVRVEAPGAHQVAEEPEYKNSALYVEVGNPASSSVAVTLEFDVTRRAFANRPSGERDAAADHVDPVLLQRFRQPDALVPLSGRIAETAEQATAGRTTPIDKARAIYDYVTTHLRYDKSGSGWGRGDAVWACDAKRGNCTDFHSLLVGMARSVGIPAKFEIGVPLPEDVHEGEIPGYHCWAAMYLDGIGWVPVDSSEGSKHPDKREYFFGALDANRVRFSLGRDLRLNPPQAGPPLNYFVYPYVEVDGQPVTTVTQHFFFRDLPAAQ